MTIGTRIMPNLIGIDIGCGMTLAEIKDKKVEYQKLDKVIRENIPSGYAIRKEIHHHAEYLVIYLVYFGGIISHIRIAPQLLT